jgi:hypothetical protein
MIKEITIYTIVCDVCGKDANENTDYAGWTELEPTVDVCTDNGWYIDDDRHYCDDCHSFDDDDNLIVKERI